MVMDVRGLTMVDRVCHLGHEKQSKNGKQSTIRLAPYMQTVLAVQLLCV